jgi:signal transduction histidine kinase
MSTQEKHNTTSAQNLFARLSARVCAGVAVLFVVSVPNAAVFAQQRYYEHAFVLMRELSGGHLLLGESVGEADAAENSLFFHFKRKPYGMSEADVASVWNGVQQASVRSNALQGASVLHAAMIHPRAALALLVRDSTWLLAELGADARPRRQKTLPLTADALGNGYGFANGLLKEQAQVPIQLQRPRQADMMAFAVQEPRTELLLVGNRQRALVRIGGMVLMYDVASDTTSAAQLLTQYSVLDVIVLNADTRNASDPAFAYVVQIGLRRVVVVANEQGATLAEYPLNTERRVVLKRVSNYVLAACEDMNGSTMVNILQPTFSQRGMVSVLIPAAPELLCVVQRSALEQSASEQRSGEQSSVQSSVQSSGQSSVQGMAGFAVYFLGMELGVFTWNVAQIQASGSIPRTIKLAELPERLFVPLAVERHKNELFALFQHGMASFSLRGELRSLDAFVRPLQQVERVQALPVLIQSNDAGTLYVFSIQHLHLLVQRRTSRFWWLRNIVADWWLYALGFAVVALIGTQYYRLSKQQRLLNALFEMPGADVLIILDDEGKLQTLNDAARKLLSMPPDVPMRRLFQFYCVGMSTRALEEFVAEALAARVPLTKKIAFLPEDQSTERIQLAPGDQPSQDFLFSAIPVRTRFGAVKGLMLIGKDITEELEKKRFVNWAQLAHDMQNNLTTIKLNAEYISQVGRRLVGEKGEEPGNRILLQVNLLMKRVRDLVEMSKDDGALQKPLQADTADICLNVRREFDARLYPSVKFEIDAQHVLFSCYQVKLERAIRNAVENGIRAMPNNAGVIRIAAWAEAGFVYFDITDSGEGMSEDVMKNMMKQGFTTFKEKGGSGMGTMIMRHIIQLHGGEMIVSSERGKGTTIRFRLPARDAKKLNVKPLRLVGDVTLV